MNWTNVRLIFAREVRDQLRDRRTLFMIFVLPVLMYPLLGMSVFQVAQFVRQRATRVLVVGAGDVPALPSLFQGSRFAATLFDEPDRDQQMALIDLEFASGEPRGEFAGQPPEDTARQVLADGRFETVLAFPPDFSRQLHEYRAALERRTEAPGAPRQALAFPQVQLFHNTAREKSSITYQRVRRVLDRWSALIAQDNLDASAVPMRLDEVLDPVKVQSFDVADDQHRDAALWSKLFPFLLIIWALTGAFYPAVDLCAGEKERGTLETLLAGPAERAEIVWGKLLTVMLFSMATVVCNVLSMGVTGTFVLSQLPNISPPSWSALGWLLVALPPASAWFSAMCLALAAFARSTKEGQYYLMPLILVTMPLVMLPMAPGFDLTLGNSLIPVTGLVLLLRAVFEGDYWVALTYLAPVTAVTGMGCLLAIRWAVDQFNSEAVLFREGERFSLGLWLRHLVRDREPTPGVAMAVFAGVLILLLRFFVGFSLPHPSNFDEVAVLLLATQLAVILAPVLLMAVLLTDNPRQTLLLRWPHWSTLPAAVLLALGLHPAANVLQAGVMRLYPIHDEMTAQLSKLLAEPSSIWLLLLVIAVVPAVCEELAFRGFLLSGFRHLGRRRWAVALASLFFAISHSILQQSLVAGVVGLILGFLAVQTGSIVPPILYHMTHNALGLLPTLLTPERVERYPVLEWIFKLSPAEGNLPQLPDNGLIYTPGMLVVGSLLALSVIVRLWQLPLEATAEETLHDAICRQDQAAPGLG